MLGLLKSLWHRVSSDRENAPGKRQPSLDPGQADANRAEGAQMSGVVDREADFEGAKREAERLLREHRVFEPPVPILDIAKESGLTVTFARFKPEDASVSGFIRLETAEIFVNIAEPARRQTFTVAHELGHWCLHRKLIEENPTLYRVLRRGPIEHKKSHLEQEADSFAAHLLVPNAFLERYVHGAAFQPSHSILSQLFGVSEEVIHYRLKDERRRRTRAR